MTRNKVYFELMTVARWVSNKMDELERDAEGGEE